MKARKNVIIDETGKQIAIVMPVNCTMRDARLMAAFAAQQMNVNLRDKALAAAKLEEK